MTGLVNQSGFCFPMNLLDFMILSLATWRLSSLLVSEAGPFYVLARLRGWAGVTYDEYGQPISDGLLSGLFSCVWCMSVWVGLLLCLFVYYGLVIWLLPLALSAAAIIVERMVSDG